MECEEVVFLFDVDNTLLDNDGVIGDLRHRLQVDFGVESTDRYFAIFEELRNRHGYADYLEFTLERTLKRGKPGPKGK